MLSINIFNCHEHSMLLIYFLNFFVFHTFSFYGKFYSQNFKSKKQEEALKTFLRSKNYKKNKNKNITNNSYRTITIHKFCTNKQYYYYFIIFLLSCYKLCSLFLCHIYCNGKVMGMGSFVQLNLYIVKMVNSLLHQMLIVDWNCCMNF